MRYAYPLFYRYAGERLLIGLWLFKKCGCWFAFKVAFKYQRQFQGVVVTPHAAFAAGNFAARRYVIPPVGAVVYAVQNQALVVALKT